MRIQALFTLFLLFVFAGLAVSAETGHATANEKSVQIRVTVTDADQKIPIELARVVLIKNGQFVVQGATNTAGQLRFRDVEPGTYTMRTWFIGYATLVDTVVIDHAHSTFEVSLKPQGVQENELVVTENRGAETSHIDQATGNQVFESETYHVPPTARMTNLIQQNLLGAVRAPTGEVHIRGQHGEFTYYIDGLPVPLGVFGGLNEVVDPKVIDRATFVTGGFPAEYGGQSAAIIDLNNRVPTGTFHLDASTYLGSYFTTNGTKAFSPAKEGDAPASSGDTLGPRVGPFRALNSNGQALGISDHFGNLGYYVSATRQETDRRIDPPTSDIFHDHGFDYFVYGKFDYLISSTDFLTSNLNIGQTLTQVPYDTAEGIASDIQKTSNGFQTLSYYHTMNGELDKEENFFVGGYAREGGLTYTPGDIDPPSFQFADDTVNYLLTEKRSFTTVGLRSTYDRRFSHEFVYKIGLNASSSNGTEKFTSKDSTGAVGPSITTNFAGSDVGVFAQLNWHPAEWTSFDVGARYDQHVAPDMPLQHQVSPRLRWNFLIDQDNTAYLYYGRLFMPTNIEGLRSIALNVSNSLAPTLPERDDFYEAVYTHAFPNGVHSKLAAFFKQSIPGVDDQTVGNSAVKTPVNIADVKVTGIELGLTYNSPETPWSAFLNSSLIHAYGSGLISGGFLDFDTDGDVTDLDHDQRLSVVTGINYQPQDWFANLTGIYGSGLANGNEDATFTKGLFDFNQAAHTTPSWIFNLSGGHTYHMSNGATFEPSLYITNLLDHNHLIKGAYFSGASWEEPRNVVLKLAYHM